MRLCVAVAETQVTWRGVLFNAALSPIFYRVVVVLVIFTESVFDLGEYIIQKPVLWSILRKESVLFLWVNVQNVLKLFLLNYFPRSTSVPLMLFGLLVDTWGCLN